MLLPKNLAPIFVLLVVPAILLPLAQPTTMHAANPSFQVESTAGRRWHESESQGEHGGARADEINVAGYVLANQLPLAFGPVYTYETFDIPDANGATNVDVTFHKLGLEGLVWLPKAGFRPYLKLRYDVHSAGSYTFDSKAGAYDMELVTSGAHLGLGMQWQLTRRMSLVTESNFGFEMIELRKAAIAGKKVDPGAAHADDFNSKSLLLGLAAGL